MRDYLDADCVFTALIAKKIFNTFDWKIRRNNVVSYQVTFEHIKKTAISSFTVYIKEGRHCIGKTTLVNQAKRFHLPIDDVFLQCALS
jgi:hypothetical protein